MRFLSNGRKRKFGLAALINLILTNTLLQILIRHGLSISLSTLTAQVFNCAAGYITYGKYTFNAPVRNVEVVSQYLALSMSLWMLNWMGITTLQFFGIGKQSGALLMIPFLGAASYTVQSKLIFRKP